MSRITKLTSEQEARLPIYREEMRARALRLDWASEDEIRSKAVNLYAAAGLEKPVVLVLDSPLACLAARTMLKEVLKGDQLRDQLRDQLGGQLGGQLWGQLRDQLRDQLWDQLWDQLGDQLGGQLRDQLGGQLGGQLWDQLRDQLWGQLWDQLGGQLGGQLWDQLRDQLGGQLWGQLWDQLGGQLRDQLRGQLGGQLWDQLWDQLGGHIEYESLWFSGGSEHYWAAQYQFASDIGVRFGADRENWLSCWIDYADTCGALYPYDKWAFVSRRPTALVFDEQQRLHSEAGPAMRFKDGYSLYAFNGVRLPEEWVLQRESIDPSVILACENVEQRAAGCALLGWPRVAEKLDRKIVDGDPESDIGAVVELTLPGLPEPGRFLMAECPRNGTICEGLPRISEIDGLPINTAIAAQAWRDGLAAAEYSHPPIRT